MHFREHCFFFAPPSECERALFCPYKEGFDSDALKSEGGAVSLRSRLCYLHSIYPSMSRSAQWGTLLSYYGYSSSLPIVLAGSCMHAY